MSGTIGFPHCRAADLAFLSCIHPLYLETTPADAGGRKSLASLAGWMLFIKHNFFKNLQLSTASVGASGCSRRPSEGKSILITFPLSTGWWVNLSGTAFVLNLPHGPIYLKHMMETLLGDGLKFSRVHPHSLPFHCGSQSLHS